MPRMDHDQFVDVNGNVISDVVVQRQQRVVTDEEARRARRTLRNMVDTYWDPVAQQPQGTITAAHTRNWLLALTVAVRHLANESDDET